MIRIVFILSIIFNISIRNSFAGIYKVVNLATKTLISHPTEFLNHFEYIDSSYGIVDIKEVHQSLNLEEVIGSSMQLGKTILMAKTMEPPANVSVEWHPQAKIFSVVIEQPIKNKPNRILYSYIDPGVQKQFVMFDERLRKFVLKNRNKPITMEQLGEILNRSEE